MSPRISVVIPVHNGAKTLRRTLESLHRQQFTDFEVIVVDDGSTDGSPDLATGVPGLRVDVLRHPTPSGPASARNRGIAKARAAIVAFTDADVVLPPDWLTRLDEAFADDTVRVIVGNVIAPPSTVLGNAIAAQGFPGGGSIGFDKMWKVSPEGYTGNITSCNFAARKDVFETYGAFDESFPLAGGEDTELSYRFGRQGVKIKYVPSVTVFHPPRTGFFEWVRWQISRGRASYQFKQKIGDVSGYVRLRIWSSWNVVKASFPKPRFPLVVLLLAMSFVLQQWGYLVEKLSGRQVDS